VGQDRDDEDAEADESVGESQAEPEPEPESKTEPDSKSKSGGRWWAILGVIMLVELFVYGRRAEIEVCVGKEGVHDFELRDQARDDANRWKFPRCETRMNLGLRSRYDERVQEAVAVACRGATLFRNRGESKPCLEQADGWQHRIDARYVWPWDPRFYEHLFWFLQ
jgi:hypothetical protein